MARYLVAADLADDPEQGYAYAQAAKRLAARVGVVREACGIVAYRTGRWAEALSELRAARRMTGRDDYLPIMADCERALGRLDRALALVREASTADLDRATQIELRIVESGIRRDQGLSDAAVLALQVPELTRGRLRPWSARLFYAYADALLAAGRADEARDAFARAVQADPDGETDAADRLDQLDGIEFDDLEDDDLDLDASDLHDIDAEADKPEEGGLDDDADGDDLGQRDLDEENTRTKRARLLPTPAEHTRSGRETDFIHLASRRLSPSMRMPRSCSSSTMLFSYWAAAGRHVSRKPDSGHAGTISITVPMCRTRWNGMKPRIQCVLTHWIPGFTASGCRFHCVRLPVHCVRPQGHRPCRATA